MRFSLTTRLLILIGFALCVVLFFALPWPVKATWLLRDYGLDGAVSVFRGDQVITFDLTLSEADWLRLRSNPRAESYVPASLRVGTELVGSVGLRFKGGLGTLHGLPQLQSDVLDPSDLPKLSFKINFGKYEPNKRFHGFSVVNLHSMHGDPSLMRERLAYSL